MLIFLDLETTGVSAEDFICSVALLHEKTCLHSFVNEAKKISSEASSKHNITNEMIASAPIFKKSEIAQYLEQYNKQEYTLIVHNLPFIMEKLQMSSFVWQGDVIDTKRVIRHLMQECDYFSLEYLRYELKLYKNEPKIFQDYGIKDAICTQKALQDVVVIKSLYQYLLDYASLEKMKSLSFEPVLIEKLPFGKYKGHYIEEVFLEDRAYLVWLLQNSVSLDEDLEYSLQYYLEKESV